MKFFYFSLLSLFVFTLAGAQDKAGLKFNDSGEFKIVQFTDTHVNLTDNSNLEVYNTIKTILDIEKPDLIVLTGDIVTQDNPQEAYLRFDDIFTEAGIPWAMVFGNHESEHNFSRKQLADFLQQLPFCLNNDKGETHGNSNFVLTVSGKDKKTDALLYFMDSNEYSTLKPLVDGWGWFDYSQVGWYRQKSKNFTQLNGGEPLPALAFFHIPLPEYYKAWTNKTVTPVGVRNEDECSPEINTGMFAAMLECGDVMGTFVGHDHINDYIGIHFNITLAYGRVTKIMKDPEDPLAGGRVIVLKEGKREFDTWIRDLNGNKVLECSYPESFKEEKKSE